MALQEQPFKNNQLDTCRKLIKPGLSSTIMEYRYNLYPGFKALKVYFYSSNIDPVADCTSIINVSITQSD